MRLKRILIKRKYWAIAVVLGLLIGWGSGFLTGWFGVKGNMGAFPPTNSGTRLLIVSPHPDDETLIAGGLIQRVLKDGGKVKVVFLTNGDSSRGTAISEDKTLSLKPDEFLALGEQRMQEAKNADESLGLDANDLVFLGFPDQGLTKIMTRYYSLAADGSYTSGTTKFNHVPYDGTYQKGQLYTGENLYSDLKDIVDQFQPTMVITTHDRDSHPDHKEAYGLVTKLKNNEKANWSFFSALVHFRDYPDKNRSGYLYPPKKLFGADWVSFELNSDEKKIKMNALTLYKSQYANLSDKFLFKGLTSSNEIFENE